MARGDSRGASARWRCFSCRRFSGLAGGESSLTFHTEIHQRSVYENGANAKKAAPIDAPVILDAMKSPFTSMGILGSEKD